MRLSHHYVVPHVSTGDMLRAAVKQGTAIGLKAKDQMDRGELLGDELIMDMVAERLQESDVRARGFVLDGCPRTVAQAERLAEILAPFDLDLAIDIEIHTSQVLRRLAARRVCVDCGANYSLSAPPLINWTCDVCGGRWSSARTTPKRPSPAAWSCMSTRPRRSSTGTSSGTSCSRSRHRNAGCGDPPDGKVIEDRRQKGSGF